MGDLVVIAGSRVAAQCSPRRAQEPPSLCSRVRARPHNVKEASAKPPQGSGPGEAQPLRSQTELAPGPATVNCLNLGTGTGCGGVPLNDRGEQRSDATFPAIAGLFPRGWWVDGARSRGPRGRGGGPWVSCYAKRADLCSRPLSGCPLGTATFPFSPQLRGCPLRSARYQSCLVVIPAYAGVPPLGLVLRRANSPVLPARAGVAPGPCAAPSEPIRAPVRCRAVPWALPRS